MKNTYTKQVSGSYGDGPKPPTNVPASKIAGPNKNGGKAVKVTNQTPNPSGYRKQVSGSHGG
jgi:hypothetical protein